MSSSESVRLVMSPRAYHSGSTQDTDAYIDRCTSQIKGKLEELNASAEQLSDVKEKGSLLRCAAAQAEKAFSEFSAMKGIGYSPEKVTAKFQHHMEILSSIERAHFDKTPVQNVFSAVLQATKNAMSSFSLSTKQVTPVPAPQPKLEPACLKEMQDNLKLEKTYGA